MSSTAKTTNKPAREPARCPLCGGLNQCALAADPKASECWCDLVVFPEELLAQIPDHAVRKTCVCQKCLAQFDESANVSDENL